jgi:hypothetical protein
VNINDTAPEDNSNRQGNVDGFVAPGWTLWRQDYRQHRGSNRRMPKAERFDFATCKEAEAALTEA